MPLIDVSGLDPVIIVGNTQQQPVVIIPGGTPVIGVPVVSLDPSQVVGLIPLYPCDSKECRQICEDGWKNPVFGELIGNSYQQNQTYENDWNSFFIDVSIYKSLAVTITMKLEKFFQGSWRPNPFAPDLGNNSFGIYYPLGSVSGHPTYAGYDINWGAVLAAFGAGCYRFKIYTSFTTTTTGAGGSAHIPIPITYQGCLQSPTFELKPWNCFLAHGTVKWETWNTGLIGDPYIDYKEHDLCGILKYDSIRLRGFFGYEKSPGYIKNNLKWGPPQPGKVEKVSDEQTQRWEYLSGFLPEYIHSRFATFAMMSDRLFVSDYNINNSNWTYKRKNVIYDSGYEPEYIDKEAFWQRRNRQKVQVYFNRGVQSVIHSLCCPVRATT